MTESSLRPQRAAAFTVVGVLTLAAGLISFVCIRRLLGSRKAKR
jgi:hypothetical protein